MNELEQILSQRPPLRADLGACSPIRAVGGVASDAPESQRFAAAVVMP